MVKFGEANPVVEKRPNGKVRLAIETPCEIESEIYLTREEVLKLVLELLTAVND